MQIKRGQSYINCSNTKRIEIYQIAEATNTVTYIENGRMCFNYIDVLKRLIKKRIWILEED